MPQEIVSLRVGVIGDKEALVSLQKLDSLAQKLNQTTVNIKINTSGVEVLSAEMQKSLNLVNKNISAQARLLEAQNRQATVQSRLLEAQNRQAQIQAKVAVEAQKTQQQIARAEQAVAKAAQETEKTKQAQARVAQEAEKTAQAQAKVESETQKTAQAQEKTKQATEQTKQAVEATAQAQAKVNQEMARTATEAQRTATIEERRGLVADQLAARQQAAADASQRAAQNIQSSGNAIIGMLATMAKWQAVNMVINVPVSAIRDALEELKAVDSELVSIRKVTGMSAAEMESLSDKAFEVGSALGVGASEYLASATKWAQAGYGSLADDLAELSVMTQKVGDVDEATANQFLLSVDAAYKYQGSIESLKRVLDGANEISNNYVASVEKLASGMGLVSSLAAQAGMEVAETTAAIGTITSITQESGSSAARALRALILNIQGESEIAIDEETGERWSEEQIEDTAEALNQLNIQTREYRNGLLELRDPMDVIGEIAEKYREGIISDTELQSLVSDLGGKTRSNQLQALITNFDMYEDMVETFKESTGSADREIQYYLDSWEAKSNRLKNSWVELIENFKASDAAKNILDIGNALLSVANSDLGQYIIQVTALTAAITALAMAYREYAMAKVFSAGAGTADVLNDLRGLPALIKNIAQIKNLGKVISNAANAFKLAKAALAGGGGFTAALTALGTSALAVAGTIAVVIGALVGAVKLYDYLNVSAEEQRELATAAQEEYKNATTEIENLNTQLKDTDAKIAEIKAKGQLSLTDQRDLQNLEEQNRVLEAQLALQEAIQKVAAQNAITETAKVLEKGSSQSWADIAAGTNLLWSTGKVQWTMRDFRGQIELLNSLIAESQKARDEIVQMADDENSLTKQQQKTLEGHNKTIEQLTSGLGSLQSELVEHYNSLEGVEGAEELRAEFAELIDLAANAVNPFDSVIQKIEGALNDLEPDTLEKFNEALRQLGEDGEVTAEEIAGLADEFPFLNDLMANSGVTAQELADYFLQAGEAANTISSDIERLTEIMNPLESSFQAAKTALNEYTEAAGAQDFDNIYDGFGSAIDDFFDDYEQGIRNSKQLWATAELFFTPEQLEEMDYDIEKIAKKLRSFEDLFTGDPRDFEKMLKSMSEAGKLLDENGEKLIEFKDNGGFSISFENFDELAEKLGMSEEAFASLINYLGMFHEGFVSIDLSNLEEYIEDMGLAVEVTGKQVVNADALKEQLKEAGVNGKAIAEAFEHLSKKGYTLVSLTEQVDTLKQAMLDANVAAEDGGEFKISIPNYQEFMQQLGYSKEEAIELLNNLNAAGNVSFTNAEGEALTLQQAIDSINSKNLEDAGNKAEEASEKTKDFKDSLEDAENTAKDADFSNLSRQFQNIYGSADKAKSAIDAVREAIRLTNTFSPIFGFPTTKSNGPDIEARATGTNRANGGLTLLGDEPGDTPKPELVIEDDRAFLAGQNGPEIVNLKPGAQVLKYSDTMKALGRYKLDEMNGIIPAKKNGGDGTKSFSGIQTNHPTQYNPDKDPNYKDPNKSSSSSGSSNKGSSSGSSSSSGGSNSSKSSSAAKSEKTYWEEALDALDDYLDGMQTLTEVIERSEAQSYEKRLKNFRAMQEKVHATAEDFRKRGLSENSKEIQELKAKWLDLADDIEDVYKSMYDDLMEMHQDDEWDLEVFNYNREKSDRTIDEIVADNNKIVAQYKQMQDEVHRLAEYYRSEGYGETSDLIQDLQQKWIDYQDEIESVYENLTNALDDYIDTSSQKLKELERAGASAGERIAVYLERIAQAQKTIAALQANNWGGKNDESIWDIQDQIWDDQDAIKDIQQGLWDELEAAIGQRFDLKQEEIDELQDKIDDINKIIDQYNKELEKIVEPINKTLEALNEQLQAEKDHLESLTDPLRDKIEGYYKRNEDGSLEYVEGIDDKLDKLQDELDKENDRYNEEKEQREEELALERKQLAVQEAIKNLEQALIDLETARNERPLYTLKDGVWAWRPDEEAIKDAEQAVEDAEQAKEDAENDLKEYEEDLKHQQIIDALQDQIDALEKEKKLINKQIDLYQKESEARQKYIQQQIEYWEKEKEAHEEYYEKLTEQYEDEIEVLKEHKEQLEEQLDEWRETWEDIQKGLEEPARDIQDILNDIAKYGTPAMKDQIDRVVELLKQLGDNLDDFNPDYGDDDWGGDAGGGSGSQSDIVKQMMENSAHWLVADSSERREIEAENERLGAQIGATYDDRTGYWYDKNGDILYDGNDPYLKNYIVRMMQQNSQAWTNASSSSEKRKYEELNQILGNYIGASYDDRTGYWYDRDGSRLYDSGGVAYGKGVMQKAVDAPEIVLPPVVSEPLLDPTFSREFQQFAQSMDFMFSAARSASALNFTPASQISNHSDRHDIHINGVTIGESMLQRPLSETLALLQIHINDDY